MTRNIPDDHGQTGLTAPVGFDKIVIISACFVTIYARTSDIESGKRRIALGQKTLLNFMGKSQSVAHAHVFINLGDDLVERLYDQISFIIKTNC